ncbi:23S rRNA pseudouridine1911/1915/1917 synthase [Isobaculum melis]|uniref:Pseudouridine synthase n=2 Tax=Isobaculum melis TaxID=142588 RepID=A0A1H9T9D1_9LACT|nr:23S rRNA pseudouridine1911/1915/1917 synthase [Isobaculum melis]
MRLSEREKKMKFSWTYENEEAIQVKQFLRTKDISRALLAKIKFNGGLILVNDIEKNAIYFLKKGDQVTVVIPDEAGHETTIPVHLPIDIVYEDEHLLIVNKPSGVASITSQVHPSGTMANRVKGYYVAQNYPNQVIHIVTRLDRDTTGLMLFAKHGYAHAKMDIQLRKKQMTKKYQALISGSIPEGTHQMIDAPIGRVEGSLMERQVRPDGKVAQTEFWVASCFEEGTLVDIQLHTGRTHQIRVHFAAIHHPLIGDDLYGGKNQEPVERQALHCAKLVFHHPFTGELLTIESPLPQDMQGWLANQK